MERTRRGWLNGLIGVLIFSGSLPATRLAVMDFDPVFLTGARAVLAALLAALALQRITSAHAMVFIGALPLATAVFAVLRGGERPRAAFWLFSVLGSCLIAGYALAQGVTAAPVGDALMLAAIIACGLGYASLPDSIVQSARQRAMALARPHGALNMGAALRPVAVLHEVSPNSCSAAVSNSGYHPGEILAGQGGSNTSGANIVEHGQVLPALHPCPAARPPVTKRRAGVLLSASPVGDGTNFPTSVFPTVATR